VGALVGALSGAALTAWLKPSDEALVSGMLRHLPEISPDKARGAVIGAVNGAAVGAFLIAIVGRTLGAWLALLLLMIAGATYGGLREPGFSDMSWTFLVLSALAGILGGGLLGLLFGAIRAAAGNKQPQR
jgi:hypothetical protein